MKLAFVEARFNSVGICPHRIYVSLCKTPSENTYLRTYLLSLIAQLVLQVLVVLVEVTVVYHKLIIKVDSHLTCVFRC